MDIKEQEIRNQIKNLRLQLPKKNLVRKLPSVLSIEEVHKLFSVITSPRDLMLLQTIYYLGSRAGETIQIRKCDVYLKDRYVILRAETTKRKKERRQPIPLNFVRPLQQYITNLNEEDTLFKIRTTQRVWQIVKEYAEKADIKKKIHPHTLRHSYATHIYEKTGDIEKVKELLGHEDISTTQIYTHVSQKSKKETVDSVFK